MIDHGGLFRFIRNKKHKRQHHIIHNPFVPH